MKKGETIGKTLAVLLALCLGCAGGVHPVLADDTTQNGPTTTDWTDTIKITKRYTDTGSDNLTGADQPQITLILRTINHLNLTSDTTNTTGGLEVTQGNNYGGYTIEAYIQARGSENTAGYWTAKTIKFGFSARTVDQDGNLGYKMGTALLYNPIFYVGNGEPITQVLAPYAAYSSDWTQFPYQSLPSDGAAIISLTFSRFEIDTPKQLTTTGGGDLGTGGTQEEIDANNDKIQDAQNQIAEYQEQESELIEDNASAIDNFMNTKVDAIQDGITNHIQMVRSAQWVRTKFGQLISNTPFESYLEITLLIGVALYIIGKLR